MTNRQTGLEANENETWRRREEKRRKKFIVNHCWLRISVCAQRTETAFTWAVLKGRKAMGRKPKGESHTAGCESG